MKILIIDGFSHSEEGRSRFRKYYNSITHSFTQSTVIGLINPEFIVRTLDTISEYLYDPATSYANPEAKKLLERIDAIFVDGEINIMPWFKVLSKLRILFRSCKLANIRCLATGMGLAMLVYYCSTGYREIEVLNGNERGGCVDSIVKFNPKEIKLKHQVFLDNATGDVYEFSQELQQWIAVCNVGLHLRKSADAFGSMGTYFKKAKLYRIKPIKEMEDYSLSIDETMCYLKKAYVQHWLLRGLKMEFKTSQKNKWDPHPINIQENVAGYIGNNYFVLAESDKGPQIIEHNNTIATQFHLDPIYSQSIQILDNFVKLLITNIQSKTTENRINIDVAYNRERIAISKLLEEDTNGDHTLRPSTVKSQTSKFMHSGLNYSKRRGELIVLNNAFGSFIKVNPKEYKSDKTNRLKHSNSLSIDDSKILKQESAWKGKLKEFIVKSPSKPDIDKLTSTFDKFESSLRKGNQIGKEEGKIIKSTVSNKHD